MEQFDLTDQGLKDRSRAVERSTIFSVLLAGLFLLAFLSLFLYWLNWFRWVYLIAGLACVWGIVELLVSRTRRNSIGHWRNLKIEYLNSVIVETKNDETTTEVRRNEIQYICEFKDGIDVGDLEDAIFIPKEISGYAELVDELRKWRPIETRPTHYDFEPTVLMIKKFVLDVLRLLELIFSSSPSRQLLSKRQTQRRKSGEKLSLREQRMRDIRQTRRQKGMQAILGRNPEE